MTTHSTFKLERRGPRGDGASPPLGDVLTENQVASNYFRRAGFERWCLSEGLSWVQVLENWPRAMASSWRRFESLTKGDSSGSAPEAAADTRINRALADAVERRATKDPGVRCTQKRASVVCHPESDP